MIQPVVSFGILGIPRLKASFQPDPLPPVSRESREIFLEFRSGSFARDECSGRSRGFPKCSVGLTVMAALRSPCSGMARYEKVTGRAGLPADVRVMFDPSS